MQKLLFEGNGNVDEEDLKPKGGININPQPIEWCRICCGRPQSELPPIVEGLLLSKNYRRHAPFNEVVHNIYDEFFGICHTDSDFKKAHEKLVIKYGEKKADQIITCVDLSNFVRSGPECRDCVCQDDFAVQERYLDSLKPPERCDCCGRHLGELKPFTEGDPVADYFNGKLLARRYRPDAPPTEGVNKMMDEFFGNCITNEDHIEAEGKLIQKYGKEEAYELWTFAFYLDGLFKSSWECKDCICLDTAQYFKKKMAQE